MKVLGRIFLNSRKDVKTERRSFFVSCRRTYVLNNIKKCELQGNNSLKMRSSVYKYLSFNKKYGLKKKYKHFQFHKCINWLFINSIERFIDKNLKYMIDINRFYWILNLLNISPIENQNIYFRISFFSDLTYNIY